jgi:hypothetical protein
MMRLVFVLLVATQIAAADHVEVRPSPLLDFVILWDKYTSLISIDDDTWIARIATYDEKGDLQVFYSAPCHRSVAGHNLALVAQTSACFGPKAAEWTPDSFFITRDPKGAIARAIDNHLHEQDAKVVPEWEQKMPMKTALTALLSGEEIPKTLADPTPEAKP